MATPRAPSSPARKDSNYDRERRRDGGKGANLPHETSGAAVRKSKDGRSREGEEERDAEEGEDRIGPYRIGEEVGRGSFATVFKGARFVRSSSSTLSAIDMILHHPFVRLLIPRSATGHRCTRRSQVGHQEQAHFEAPRESRVGNLDSEAHHSSEYCRTQRLSRQSIIPHPLSSFSPPRIVRSDD